VLKCLAFLLLTKLQDLFTVDYDVLYVPLRFGLAPSKLHLRSISIFHHPLEKIDKLIVMVVTFCLIFQCRSNRFYNAGLALQLMDAYQNEIFVHSDLVMAKKMLLVESYDS
jgi:hypothetical protein